MSSFNNILVKICGLTDAASAKQIAISGVDYIGLLFTKHSKRQIDIASAKNIIAAIKPYSTKIVGVFFDEDLEQIDAIDKALDYALDYYQLHGATPRKALSAINAQRNSNPINMSAKGIIYVVNNENQGMELPLSELNWHTDFILYDGVTLPSPAVLKANKLRFLIAGKLNANNVLAALNDHQPDGVDLSSGVESSPGVKCIDKIRTFLKVLRPAYYGAFGGMFVPEILMLPLYQLANAYEQIVLGDPSFMQEFKELLCNYVGRPTALTVATNFATAIGLKNVYLKREDLTHTGAHKINNALGQCLLAKRLAKTRIIAETGAGQHGVATATIAAKLGLECVIYMGAVDMARQMPNVIKMRLLGARVVEVTSGSATLKDAVNEALRDWATSYESTHYCLGTALGPHPFPTMCAYFQQIIGIEAKEQFAQITKNTPQVPDMIIACVGGGSNAIGIFRAFLPESESTTLANTACTTPMYAPNRSKHNNIAFVGVEAGGTGCAIGNNAARFMAGRVGVLHGNKTYVLQTADNQIANTHSISAGLDYAAVGPEHADLFTRGVVKYVNVNDDDALAAFILLSKTEGIIPALESAHALAYLMRIASNNEISSVFGLNKKTAHILVNLSGRGDKDLPSLIADNHLNNSYNSYNS